MKRLNAVVGCSLLVALLGLAGGQLRSVSSAPEKVDPSVVDASRYPTLQAAFDALPESGGLVRLPPGRFELTRPLVLTREDTRVEGAGTSTHLVNLNQDGHPALIVRPPSRSTAPRARIWRVQLADFRVSGNPKSGDGILAEGVNEILIHNVSVDHHGDHGINLVDCYEDPRVSDSIVTYNGKAGLNIVRGHDIVVNGNQFEENQDAVRCIDSFNLCMNGNAIDDHLRHGVVIENTYGSVLSGNMIEECKEFAMILDRDCYGITLSANVVAHNGGGIHLRDAWGCAVSGNTFTIVGEDALVVGPEAGRINITGNNFSNSFVGSRAVRAEQDSASGITLKGTKDVVVSGNIFTGLTTSAVVSEGDCRRVLVDGNLMADLGRKLNGKDGKAGRVEPVELKSVKDGVTGQNLMR